MYCLDLQGNELYHLNTRNSGLQNDIILDIIEKDGQLWLATDGGGINILDKKSRTVSSIQHIPGDNGSLPVNSITCLYTDPGNNIWAGSVRGGMFGIKEVDIKTYKDVPLNHPNGLSEKTVISLYEDETGILWIGTDGGGINSYHPRQNRFKHYATTYGEKVVSITPYSEEELMVSFFCNGLYLFNKKQGNTGLSPSSIQKPTNWNAPAVIRLWLTGPLTTKSAYYPGTYTSTTSIKNIYTGHHRRKSPVSSSPTTHLRLRFIHVPDTGKQNL